MSGLTPKQKRRSKLITQDAIVVGDVAELIKVLPKLIAATEAGELDTQINAITNQPWPAGQRGPCR